MNEYMYVWFVFSV